MDYEKAKNLLDNYFDGFDLSRSDALKISDFIESLYERASRAESERDKAIECLRGNCYLCKKAKPYKIGVRTFYTCDKMDAKVRVKNPKCEYFEWDGI